MNGSDYGSYNTSGGCSACKDKCRNDVNCGGVECGGKRWWQKCNWWKHGFCGTSDLQTIDVTGQYTCMKYDAGKFYILAVLTKQYEMISI